LQKRRAQKSLRFTASTAKHAAKREKNDVMLRPKIQSGTLSQKELESLTPATATAYLRALLPRKFKRDAVRFSCQHCAIIALFEDNGFVTDEELIEDTGLRCK
jgi:hypothetical protein